MLLNRGFLSVFSSETFALVADVEHSGHLKIILDQCTVDEFTTLIAVMLMVDLKVDFSHLVTATDASSSGGGVSTASISRDEFLYIASSREKRGWYTRMRDANLSGTPGMPGSQDGPQSFDCPSLDPLFQQDFQRQLERILADLPLDHGLEADTAVQRMQRARQRSNFFVREFVSQRQWNVEVSTPWKHIDDTHINLLEAHALLLGLRNRLLRVEEIARRPIFFLDSLVVLGVVAKGRSSSTSLNHLARRIATLVGVGELRPCWLYVPTDANPADEPSRRFERSSGPGRPEDLNLSL